VPPKVRLLSIKTRNIGDVQRRQRQRQGLAERMANRDIERRVRRESRRAAVIRESGAVVHVDGTEDVAGQLHIDSTAERVALVVIERERGAAGEKSVSPPLITPKPSGDLL
jgi:hypothetical protein